jgi:hypothetical protein
MEQANSKYKLMKENSTWNAPSEQEEKILGRRRKSASRPNFQIQRR